MFSVTELTRNNQVMSVTDLTSSEAAGEECVYWLDSGPGRGKPFLVYAWVGKRASDVVIRLTKKALDTYLDHGGDKRSLSHSEWDIERRASKSTKSSALRMDVVIVK